MSNSVGWGPKSDPFGKRLASSFQYGKYKWVNCNNDVVKYEVDPLRWRGGAVNSQDNSGNDHHCTDLYDQYKSRFARGTSFNRAQNDAVNFSAAITIYGATLKAQSGFSTNVQSHWDFGDNTGWHWLCGNDAAITAAHRIFAGS